MATSPLNTPFDNPIVPGPSGDFGGITGGFPLPQGVGGDPITTPYDNGLCSGVGQSETPNSQSGLGLQVNTIDIGGQPPTNAPDISSGMIPVAGLGQK